jgi:hypothetical protein
MEVVDVSLMNTFTGDITYISWGPPVFAKKL